MAFKAANSLYCPFCGIEFTTDNLEDCQFCPHVFFVYGCLPADDDVFIYTQNSFAKKYLPLLKQSGALKEYLEENETSITAEQEDAFVENICHLDKPSQSIPFFEDIATAAIPDTMIFYFASGNYSGLYVGFNNI